MQRDVGDQSCAHFNALTTNLAVTLREMRITCREKCIVHKHGKEDARALARFFDVQIATILPRWTSSQTFLPDHSCRDGSCRLTGREDELASRKCRTLSRERALKKVPPRCYADRPHERGPRDAHARQLLRRCPPVLKIPFHQEWFGEEIAQKAEPSLLHGVTEASR